MFDCKIHRNRESSSRVCCPRERIDGIEGGTPSPAWAPARPPATRGWVGRGGWDTGPGGDTGTHWTL